MPVDICVRCPGRSLISCITCRSKPAEPAVACRGTIASGDISVNEIVFLDEGLGGGGESILRSCTDASPCANV
jgi:hypothetical protein